MKKDSKKKKKNNKKNNKYSTKLRETKFIIIILIIIVLPFMPSLYNIIHNKLFINGTIFNDVVIKDNQSVTYSEKLLKEVSRNTNENIVLSDLSINPSLAYLYSLSSSEAKSEFNNYFNLDSTILNNNYNKINERYKDAYKVINFSNSIWINKDSKTINMTSKAKSELNDSNFEVNSISFNKEYEKINKYIDKNSHGKIKGIKKEDINDTDSLLLGSLYFNEVWKDKYRSKDIETRLFKGTKETKKVSFLSSEDEKYLHTDNAIGFMKKYQAKNLYFVGILPNEGVTFDQVNINDLLDSNGECDVLFPEFEFEYNVDMKPVLKSLGINKIFAGGALDDFYKDAYVNKVLQKNYIKVNRKGTEAISIKETLSSTWGVGYHKKVILDRPFMFLIYDSSINQVLFIGRVNNL